MDSPHQSQAPRSRATIQREAVHAITDSVGRRGVRIYGLSRQQLGAVVLTIIFVGIPLFFFLSMLPVWDHFGELSWFSRVNTYIAPAINSVDNSYRAEAFPRFPLKRFLIAGEIITAFLFWINFASLLLRKIRKHALLVWICFDRRKILLFLFLSGLLFSSEWYVLFYDWSVLHFLTLLHSTNSFRRPGARVIFWVVTSIPSIALLFGHLATIVVLGVFRATLRELRPHRI